MVPDSYAWDGYEYVGLVGDQYYYLGPGNVWLFCEPFRLERFHGWERGHADWRDTPFAMTVIAPIGTDMFSPGMTSGRERTGRTSIDSARTASRRFSQ